MQRHRDTSNDGQPSKFPHAENEVELVLSHGWILDAICLQADDRDAHLSNALVA